MKMVCLRQTINDSVALWVCSLVFVPGTGEGLSTDGPSHYLIYRESHRPCIVCKPQGGLVIEMRGVFKSRLATG